MGFTNFKTRAEAEKHRYGCWGGSPKGSAYDPACCAELIYGSERGAIGHQCSKKPGHGPDKLYCATHDPEQIKAKAVESQKKYDAKQKAERPRWFAHAMYDLLKRSRNGITVEWQRERDELLQNLDK